ncbi:MAG: DNA mismatch endonuclease Vsr [Microcystis aeruginosa Ma_MB_S_20031200_S102D]|nr:MAG: DNA mismatch endonuclease Vsr [Microcystis aeruginosa Ma_MB_S_20031200_S102D]
MADIVDKPTRSRMMAGIKSKNTQPEIQLRKALHAAGFRYRLHVVGLPGRPDLILPKFEAAIQVQGCFWHRHEGCRDCTTPASNHTFWDVKFSKTIARDKKNLQLLLDGGWRVATVWECALRGNIEGGCFETLSKWLMGKGNFIELPESQNSPRQDPLRVPLTE